MSKKAELLDKRATLVEQMRNVLDSAETEKRDLTQEDKDQYAAIERDFEKVDAEYRLYKKQEERELGNAEKRDKEVRKVETPEKEARAQAYRHYLQHGFKMDNAPADIRSILEAEYRAQSTLTDAAGGFTIPDEYRAQLIETMKDFGGIYSISNVVPTANGATLIFPTNDDTANSAAYVDELVEAGNAADLVFGQIKVGAHVLSSGELVISNQLLQDSAFNMEQLISRKLGERFGRKTADVLINGTGVNQPQGVLTGAAASGVTAAAASVSFDNLIDLQHSVDRAYRNNLRFVFNDSTLSVLRKIKDSDGQYIWQMGTRDGAPATILGIPYVVDQAMPTIGTGKKSILIGDFSKYMVREVRNVSIQKLVEKHATKYAVSFIGFLRHDAKVMDANAIKFLAHA
jgi:HK97 family phage major capsid protein